MVMPGSAPEPAQASALFDPFLASPGVVAREKTSDALLQHPPTSLAQLSVDLAINRSSKGAAAIITKPAATNDRVKLSHLDSIPGTIKVDMPNVIRVPSPTLIPLSHDPIDAMNYIQSTKTPGVRVVFPISTEKTAANSCGKKSRQGQVAWKAHQITNNTPFKTGK
jgi:hypothetical protein